MNRRDIEATAIAIGCCAFIVFVIWVLVTT